jgi:hypothetical protein
MVQLESFQIFRLFLRVEYVYGFVYQADVLGSAFTRLRNRCSVARC